MPTFNTHVDFAYSTIRSGGAPSPATTGSSLKLQVGDGAKFPVVFPFQATVWPSGAQPLGSNAEIIQINGLAAADPDAYLISRAQNSTTARAIQAGDQIAATHTSKNQQDVENAINQKTVVTVGTSTGADFVADGLNDGQTLQAAHDSLPSTGGKILIRNGTYNWNSSVDRVFIIKSNVTIEGESYGGVIFKAIGGVHPGGSDSLGRQGMLTFGRSQTSTLYYPTIRNIIFDCNNQSKTVGLTFDGGTSLSGTIGLQNGLVEFVKVMNFGIDSSDALSSGFYVLGGINSNSGNKGYVDKLTIRNCDIGNSNVRGLYFQGGTFTNIKIIDCHIHDCGSDGVVYFNYDGTYTSSDWLFKRVRFENNVTVSGTAYYRDSTQNGVDNLTFDECYFGPAAAGDTSSFAMTPYWANNLRITNNIFDQVRTAISLGASMSGNYNKVFPTSKMILKNNTFYRCQSTFDPDSNVFGLIKDNIFFEVGTDRVIGMYSRHFPTVIEGNLIYNCQRTTDGSEASNQLSAIQIGGDGIIVRNNYIIDDRKLTDPTSALTLSQTTGGSQGARTYYVRYTWLNETGQTIGSPEQSLAVLANKLLTTNVGFTFVPSGAISMNIYVSTTSGSGWTLQKTITNFTSMNSSSAWSWTEPTTGLTTGISLPTVNTTATKTKFGIYELSGETRFSNYYHNNYIIGVPTPISLSSTNLHTSYNNFYDKTDQAGDEVALDSPIVPITTTTISYSASLSDSVILGNALPNSLTITLPSAVNIQGRQYTIKKIDSSANLVTIATTSSQLIDGANNYILANRNESITIISDGTNWYIL